MIGLPIFFIAIMTGIILGFIFERHQFCTVRILNNAFSIKAYEGLIGLIVLILLSTILFNLALFSGIVTRFNILHTMDLSQAVICAPTFIPWINFVGAFLFGVGMVFAGMCVAGMLFRMGEGYLSSFLTFIGMALGFSTISFLNEIRIGLPKLFAGITYELCPPGVMLYDILGLNPILIAITFSAFYIVLVIIIKKVF